MNLGHVDIAWRHAGLFISFPGRKMGDYFLRLIQTAGGARLNDACQHTHRTPSRAIQTLESRRIAQHHGSGAAIGDLDQGLAAAPQVANDGTRPMPTVAPDMTKIEIRNTRRRP